VSTDRLSVAFDPPRAGWIGVRLTAPEGEFAERFSHVYSSLEQVCVAVSDAGQGLDAPPAVLLLEPAEVELKLAPCGPDDTELTVSVFPDTRRGVGRRPTSALVHRGRTRQMVQAFWRALRRLETSLPADAFAREWRSPFPTLEMSALTRLVESWRVERDGDAH